MKLNAFKAIAVFALAIFSLVVPAVASASTNGSTSATFQNLDDSMILDISGPTVMN